MTAAEAIDALRYHAHSQTCTLTPKQCAELVEALERARENEAGWWKRERAACSHAIREAVEAEREACARVALDQQNPYTAGLIRARGAK